NTLTSKFFLPFFSLRFNVLDGFLKSPDAALRFIPRHCGVHQSTPHSSGLARLACGLFTKPSHFQDFKDFLPGRHSCFISEPVSAEKPAQKKGSTAPHVMICAVSHP
ncbi:MAG: hypothetical protein Q8O11_00745, partial [Syntrophales bacterium]|nr:hypothetical protein [Syntrophales bacterium]